MPPIGRPRPLGGHSSSRLTDCSKVINGVTDFEVLRRTDVGWKLRWLRRRGMAGVCWIRMLRANLVPKLPLELRNNRDVGYRFFSCLVSVRPGWYRYFFAGLRLLICRL